MMSDLLVAGRSSLEDPAGRATGPQRPLPDQPNFVRRLSVYQLFSLSIDGESSFLYRNRRTSKLRFNSPREHGKSRTLSPSVTMSILSPPSRADIISLCTSLPCEGYMGTTTIWHDPRTSKPLFFIKYGNYVLAEGRTQQHLYDRAQSDARAPRIPQIYDVFTDDRTGREFIVMEFVPAPTLTQWLALATSDSEREARTEDGSHRVLDAIAWLYALDVSQDGPLGPVGGGIAHHRFFADHTAPMPFASTDALQAYINTARRPAADLRCTCSLVCCRALRARRSGRGRRSTWLEKSCHSTTPISARTTSSSMRAGYGWLTSSTWACCRRRLPATPSGPPTACFSRRSGRCGLCLRTVRSSDAPRV